MVSACVLWIVCDNMTRLGVSVYVRMSCCGKSYYLCLNFCKDKHGAASVFLVRKAYGTRCHELSHWKASEL